MEQDPGNVAFKAGPNQNEGLSRYVTDAFNVAVNMACNADARRSLQDNRQPHLSFHTPVCETMCSACFVEREWSSCASCERQCRVD